MTDDEQRQAAFAEASQSDALESSESPTETESGPSKSEAASEEGPQSGPKEKPLGSGSVPPPPRRHTPPLQLSVQEPPKTASPLPKKNNLVESSDEEVEQTLRSNLPREPRPRSAPLSSGEDPTKALDPAASASGATSEGSASGSPSQPDNQMVIQAMRIIAIDADANPLPAKPSRASGNSSSAKSQKSQPGVETKATSPSSVQVEKSVSEPPAREVSTNGPVDALDSEGSPQEPEAIEIDISAEDVAPVEIDVPADDEVPTDDADSPIKIEATPHESSELLDVEVTSELSDDEATSNDSEVRLSEPAPETVPELDARPSAPPAPSSRVDKQDGPMDEAEELDDDDLTPDSVEELESTDIEVGHVSSGDSKVSERPKPPPPPPRRAASVPPPPPTARSAPAKVEVPKKQRVRPWWEDLFSDDFMRACPRLSDTQIKREVDFIEESLGVAAGGVVMDLGCGAGYHSVELASRGYGVVGYDLSISQLARAADVAQERGQKLNFLQGDMREMAFEEMFDGICSWDTSFGYFEEEKNLNVAARMLKALRPGGTLLMDVANRDFVISQAPSQLWFEGEACVCLDDMAFDFITSRLRVKRTVMLDDGRTRECNYSVRLYGLHELGKLLHDVGFRVTEASGHPSTPGAFFGPASPRIIILAERPKE